MTKKKRELIDILLDNVKPEDWPEHLPYAAQDKCDSAVYVYSGIPDITSIYNGYWHPGSLDCEFIKTVDVTCKFWNKTIVHRDEFMKRWNERIHSETDTTTPTAQQEAHTEETKPIQQSIETVIQERGSNYGRFEDGAEIMQQLKLIAHTSQGWERMKPIQREGMDMILHKIGRILNGDPAYIDSWVDIEGYSNLVSSWLKGESK